MTGPASTGPASTSPAATGRVVRFHFDFISPYAYLAWTQIRALAARHGASVEPVAVLFAAMLDAHGTKGPAEVPAKRVWVFKDTFRHAAYLGVPFAPPPAHPFNPLLALRAASVDMEGDVRLAFIDELYRATWGGGPGVVEASVVGALATKVGLDAAHVLREAASDAVKARVRANTEAAITAGAFGVPTVFVGAEMFWGFDALVHVERHLEGRDPLGEGELERWRDLPAQSHRKQ